MARRPVAEEDSSVDLFLSTSCDAFGGIIFIMLMICLLPSGGSMKKSAEPEPAPTVVQPTIQPESQPEPKSVASDLRLADEKAALAKRIAEQDEKKNELSRAAKSALDDLQAREAELAKVQQELRGAPDGDVQDKRRTRTPRLHDVQKNPFYVVLQRDRVYVPIVPDAIWKANKDDFNVKEQGNSVEFSPLPSKGKETNLWVSSRDGIQNIGQKIDREKFVIHFAVYPDSIAAFYRIRDVLAGMGYDYNWTPLKPEEPLRLIQGNGAGAKAQ